MWQSSPDHCSIDASPEAVAVAVALPLESVKVAMDEINNAFAPLLLSENGRWISNGLRKEADKQFERRSKALGSAGARWDKKVSCSSDANASKNDANASKIDANASSEQCFPSPSPSPSPTPCKNTLTHSRDPVGKMRKPRDEKECIAKGQMLGMTDEQSRQWYSDCEQCGWKRLDGTPYENWPYQMVLHRDRLRSSKPPQKPNSGQTPPQSAPPTAFTLKTSRDAKERLAKQIYDRYCSEVASGREWSDLNKRAEYLQLKKEMKEIDEKIARLA
jgi:hypothetical protein